MKDPALVRAEQVAREDLVMFVNACFSCTGQREFYNDARGQAVSIEFLHAYILGNYRRLYARTLAAGINHFNQAQIVLNLLATGKQTSPEDRREEGALIAELFAANADLLTLWPRSVFEGHAVADRVLIEDESLCGNALNGPPPPVRFMIWFPSFSNRASTRSRASSSDSPSRGVTAKGCGPMAEAPTMMAACAVTLATSPPTPFEFSP